MTCIIFVPLKALLASLTFVRNQEDDIAQSSPQCKYFTCCLSPFLCYHFVLSRSCSYALQFYAPGRRFKRKYAFLFFSPPSVQLQCIIIILCLASSRQCMSFKLFTLQLHLNKKVEQMLQYHKTRSLNETIMFVNILSYII